MNNKYTEMKCRTCDNLYIRNNLDTYKTTCFPCWKKSKGFKLTDVDQTIIHLNEKIKNASKTTNKTTHKPNIKMTKNVSRKLLMLCHPDKHQNSVLAQEITQWILKNRTE